MSDQIISAIVTIGVAVLAVATIAVIVSKNAQTSNVLSAAGGAFGSIEQVALSPVTGSAGILNSLGSGAGSVSFS